MEVPPRVQTNVRVHIKQEMIYTRNQPPHHKRLLSRRQHTLSLHAFTAACITPLEGFKFSKHPVVYSKTVVGKNLLFNLKFFIKLEVKWIAF